MRRFATGLLIVISAVSLILASTSLWTRRNVINTSVFVSNVETIVDLPQVEARINDRVTTTVMSNPDVQDAIDASVAALPPRLQGTPYWAGQDRARDVVLTGATAGYVVDDRGNVVGFGGASGKGSWRSGGRPPVVGAGVGIRGWVVYADDEGGLHTAPEAAPATSPSARWPGWSIARDLAVLR